MAHVVPYKESIQYDGTNGTYIINTFFNNSVTLVSDTGTALTWADFDNQQHTVPLNGWTLRNNGGNESPPVMSNADYLTTWVEVPLPFSVPDVTLAMGYALTPTILASASANVAVDLDTTMSGTSYEASAVLAGSASLLADLAITAVTITDNNTVTVTVQNNGLVSLSGATVIVTAAELT